ncbi:EXS-domain-containing protein [Fistulina hepatica ATCC 64428]|uniref:EXS-domain-containing protein n=1 Tax=Fistulina hepatica ATCC 64428 TaxID=1128425 RepID=A0A0D7ADX7_9AGAR|nr:EXS-domain-containing protein [Fistulina hepatica ATCC 64428]
MEHTITATNGTDIPWSVSFPLPFRVLALVGLEIVGWGANMHGLDILGMDVITAMRMRRETRSRVAPTNGGFKQALSPIHLYRAVYHLFAAYTAWTFLSYVLYRYLTHDDARLVDVYRFIPMVTTLSLLGVLICPFNVIEKRERDKFLYAVRRCMTVSRFKRVYFADVVFADVLTSFAKVLGDIWISACMFLPNNSLLAIPKMDGWLKWIHPTVMSLPYLVRFRQCLIEYAHSSNQSRRPFFNAIKYATAFPVIYLSAAQRRIEEDLVQTQGSHLVEEVRLGEHPLFRLWLLAAAINSLYSFWWDVSNDWGLDLLKPSSTDTKHAPPRQLMLPQLHSHTDDLLSGRSPSHLPSSSLDRPPPTVVHAEHRPYPFGLRPVLLFPLPVYPMVVFLNLVLRLTWSAKLSSHLHSQSEGSAVVFWLEVAEIFRRWMWVFLRVEWEVIQREQTGHARAVDDDSGLEDEPEYELVFAARDDELP